MSIMTPLMPLLKLLTLEKFAACPGSSASLDGWFQHPGVKQFPHPLLIATFARLAHGIGRPRQDLPRPSRVDGSGYGVYAQRFDAVGQKTGGEFRVNTYTAGGQDYPSVAMDDAGNFTIAWVSAQDAKNGGEGIYAKRYDAAGNVLTPLYAATVPEVGSSASIPTPRIGRPSRQWRSTILDAGVGAAIQAAEVVFRASVPPDARRAWRFFFLRRMSLGFSYVAARFIWSRSRSVSQALLNRFMRTTASSPGLALTLGMPPR